jgi:hypothetical protein
MVFWFFWFYRAYCGFENVPKLTEGVVARTADAAFGAA